jgi:hypothetical protein
MPRVDGDLLAREDAKLLSVLSTGSRALGTGLVGGARIGMAALTTGLGVGAAGGR